MFTWKQKVHQRVIPIITDTIEVNSQDWLFENITDIDSSIAEPSIEYEDDIAFYKISIPYSGTYYLFIFRCIEQKWYLIGNDSVCQ